jgi:ferric-dicitrate binding protein FerR (iron transport regulator)
MPFRPARRHGDCANGQSRAIIWADIKVSTNGVAADVRWLSMTWRNIMPGRKLSIILTSVMMASCLSSGMNAADHPAARALGLMTVSGSVSVDRLPVLPSTVVFTGDTVTTSEGSAAVVRLRSGVTLALNENSELELPRDADSNEMKIRRGVLTINNPEQKAARVEVLGTSVVVQGRAGLPAICRISASGNRAEVIADRGDLEILGRGRPIHLAQGKFARLEAGASPGAPQAARKAGTVSGAIPAETVQHQGQGQEVPLKINDPVDWQDVVQTQNTGRVRISLLDGSVLNVGARSVMRIVEHNPQTQQTQVELTLGKMRSQVVKLTKSGSSFQVKTNTAVIGVVGTIFVVEAEKDSTRVSCIEGKVAVQNINPAVQGQVQLGPGQTTVVAEGAAPTAASAANAAELQTAIQRTEIPPGAGAGTTGGQVPPGGGGQAGGAVSRGAVPGISGGGTAAGGGAASGASGAGTTITIGTSAAAAAGGVSAVAGITALSKANDASNATDQANSALQDATAAANAATTAITQSQQSNPSASTPCGCGP